MISKESFIVLLLILILIIIYFIYLLFSFSFILGFKRKVNIAKQKLNILLYQKSQAIYRVLDLIDEDLNEDLLNFKNVKKYLEYIEILPDDFRNVYLELEDIYKKITKIDFKNNDKIKFELSIIEDCNNEYFSSTQIYNSYVIGYNYWRNLYLTKWIKDLFKVELKKTIN